MMTHRVRKVAAIFALTLGCGASASAQAPGGRASTPWRPLFDGRSLDGWEHVGPGRHVVANGEIRGAGGMGLLWYSREKLGNCIIRVVYWTTSERSTSGVYVRIAEKPSDPWFAVHHGFEVEIADGERSDRGSGSVYTFARANAQPVKLHEWNTLEITLRGQRVSTSINSVPVADFDASEIKPQAKDITGEDDPARGPRPEAGYIGLQNHDSNSNVFFKEVSVRPLAAE